MRAHALTCNNHVLVVVETMHKEVFILINDAEIESSLPYEQTVLRLKEEVINGGDIRMVRNS